MPSREPARSHPYPGALIVVEGIDGSGKSTQLKLLRRHLEAQGYSILFTEWNSSALVRDTMKVGKKKNLLTPTTFSLLHATDFADRYYYGILPALKAGMIVLADRYVYTAFARDTVRGVEADWVRNLYRFAAKPDLALYFEVPIDVSLDRLMTARARIKYHEAGMDLGLASNTIESFRIFQGRVLDEYARIADEHGLEVVDATTSIEAQQRDVRRLADRVLEEKRALRRIPA
ncbi:MAG TPA: dTMP kinase [Candidatus Thermoplasmatota archaeon]|nr:dTMP kinase [Candidatus Thermoplasmatota archaeon]